MSDSINEPNSELCTSGDDSENSGENITKHKHKEDFEHRWQQLTPRQKKFCNEFPFHSTVAATAEAIGLPSSTAYNWDRRDFVYEMAEEMVDRRRKGIEEGLHALSMQAIGALRKATDPSEDVDRVTSESAQFILEQLRGKATQRREVEHSGSMEIDDEEVDWDAIEDATDADYEVIDDNTQNTHNTREDDVGEDG